MSTISDQSKIEQLFVDTNYAESFQLQWCYFYEILDKNGNILFQLKTWLLELVSKP